MKLHIAVLSLSLLTPSVFAQQVPAKNIVFTGYSQATNEELLAASGLKSGGTVTEQEIQAAANKLNATGMFSNISVEFDDQALRFTLQPAENLLPVHYQSFPWWDEKTLTEKIHARLPLFHGVLSPATGLKEQVATTLTAILAEEKHIDTNVHGVVLNDSQYRPIAVGFAFEVPPVVISSIEVQGASPAHASAADALKRTLTGQRYLGDQISTQLEALRAHYRNQGFLDASVISAPSQDASLNNGRISVPLQIAITEGQQYHLGSLKLAANPLLSQEEFQKTTELHPGDVANQELLHRTLDAAGNVYRSRGYLVAKIEAVPTKNPNHTVDYQINIVPGNIFHLGEVKFENLSSNQQAEVAKVWKLAPGDVYDASYPVSFMRKNASSLQTLAGYSATYSQQVHQETHTVDVILNFQKSGSSKNF